MGNSAQYEISTQNPVLDLNGVTAAKIEITTFFSPMVIQLINLTPGDVIFGEFSNGSGSAIVLSMTGTDNAGTPVTLEFITANNQQVEFSKGRTITIQNGAFHTFVGSLFESASQPPLAIFSLI